MFCNIHSTDFKSVLYFYNQLLLILYLLLNLISEKILNDNVCWLFRPKKRRAEEEEKGMKQRCYEVDRLIEWKMKVMKLNNFLY